MYCDFNKVDFTDFINDLDYLNGGMFSHIAVISMTGMVTAVVNMTTIIPVINTAVIIRHVMMVMHLILDLLH